MCARMRMPTSPTPNHKRPKRRRPLSTFNPRRFAKPDVLRRISQKNLITFLSHYTDYLTRRGFSLETDDEGNLDLDRLSEILVNPTEDIDVDLVDALFFIAEIATVERFEELCDLAKENGITHDDECSAADLALAIWIKNPDALRRTHAEVLALRPKAFIHYRSDKTAPTLLEVPSAETLTRIERLMVGWFEANKRGSVAHIVPVADHAEGKMYFLIRHGMPFKREGSIENGRSGTVFYRPEFHDVAIYDRLHNVIALHNASRGKKERGMYLGAMGELLFDDAEYFSDDQIFTLEPLRELGADALACADVSGIDEIRLVEIKVQYGGPKKYTKMFRSTDLFASFAETGDCFPSTGRLVSAKFEITFSNANRPRTVLISLPSQANYERNEDAHTIELWMRLRGFYEDWSDQFETESPEAFEDAHDTTAVA